MKEQIINILREHPGLRKREIASYMGIHHFKILKAITDLVNEGIIYSVYYNDPANMEFYDKYYLTFK